MTLCFTNSAWEDYQWFQQHDRKLLKRLNTLIAESLRTPFEGIGKPDH
jgi:toxin YoeB